MFDIKNWLSNKTGYFPRQAEYKDVIFKQQSFSTKIHDKLKSEYFQSWKYTEKYTFQKRQLKYGNASWDVKSKNT